MADLKGTKTEANLQAAFAGESQARNKYTYFASKAKKDGYVQIAEIFSETAENEQDLKEHAASENPSEEGQEITPDKLAAMIANLGTANIEMDTEKEKPQEPVMAETLEPVRDAAEPSQEQELDDILKSMDIDDILGESVEDLDRYLAELRMNLISEMDAKTIVNIEF